MIYVALRQIRGESKVAPVNPAVRRLVRRVAPVLLIGVLPALLLGLGIVRFMLNHFFARAPYLLDSGMLSGLSYQDGLLLETPKIACNYVDLYYDVYVSPLTSLFSALSYVSPVGRLEWFSFLQGAVYVPIGLAVYFVASRLDPASALRRLPITLVAALAFSFHGLVLWMVGYPHFEAAMPGLTCLALAALVTGRTRTAWVCLALAASVRQDGGIHVACAVAPLLFLSWRGVEMTPTRRKLVITIAVAIGISVVGMVSQKLFFHPIPRLSQAYLGDPLYSHLGMEMLARRAWNFVETKQLIYYPFLATCVIAAVRRDARYLLGWIAVMPWFLFSFLAVEEVKAAFFAYGVGPLIVGVFWVYLYGAHLAPVPRRLRAGVFEAVFAVVCLTSTFGAWQAAPDGMRATASDMVFARPKDRAVVHAFVELIHQHRARFGRLHVDGSIATLALEHLEPHEIWQPGMIGVDTLAFHRDSPEAMVIMSDLIANHLDVCTRVRKTGIFICTRDRLPTDTFAGLEVDVMPASFFNSDIVRKNLTIVQIQDRGIWFRYRYNLSGWLGTLPRGTYEWTLTFTLDEPLLLEGDELARLEIVQGNSLLAFTTASKGAHEIKLRFDSKGDAPLAFRFGPRPDSPLIVTNSEVRRITVDAAAHR